MEVTFRPEHLNENWFCQSPPPIPFLEIISILEEDDFEGFLEYFH